MPTMTGFRHAPISKGLILATAGASILTQAARASRRTNLVPTMLTHALAFRSPAELLFGTLVMYYFRILERESGTNKFGAFAAATTGLASALQWAAARAGLRPPAGSSSGPYAFIFGCFVQYYFQVPATGKMMVVGWRLSDKVFLYVVGLQLLLSNGLSSLMAGGAGLVAGLVWRANLGGLQRVRFPTFITRFLSATLGPLLSSDESPAQPGRTAASASAAAAGGAGGRRGGSAATAAVGGEVPSAPHLPAASPDGVQQLVAMGFGEAEAVRALQLTDNDVQGAIGLLLNA